jgi:hypothetical protein
MHVIMGFLVGFIYVLQQQWSLEKKSRKDLKVGVLKTQQVSEQSMTRKRELRTSPGLIVPVRVA